MGEVVRRASQTLGRWVNSGVVAPAFATLGELAGLAAGAPPGAGTAVGVIVGAAAGSASEELVDVSRALWFERTERVARFADAAETAAGADLADLIDDAAQDPRKLELLALAVEAAARSLDGEKIDTLARAYVAGTKDAPAIELAPIVIDTVRQLELKHLRLLRILAGENWHEGYRAFADMRAGSPALRMWTAAEILLEDDGLSAVVDAVALKLQSLGLVKDAGQGPGADAWMLTELGRLCAGYLGDTGANAPEEP